MKYYNEEGKVGVILIDGGSKYFDWPTLKQYNTVKWFRTNKTLINFILDYTDDVEDCWKKYLMEVFEGYEFAYEKFPNCWDLKVGYVDEDSFFVVRYGNHYTNKDREFLIREEDMIKA